MQHNVSLGSSGLGTKFVTSFGLAVPTMFVETLSLVAKVALAALVAGLVNILLESARNRWRARMRRPPVPAQTPPCTEIPGEIPGGPSPRGGPDL